MKGLWLGCLLVAATLSGCAAPPAPPSTDDDFGLGDELDATDTTGVIRGVVVDATIVPVPGATVRLQDGPSTSSNEDGEFGLSGLAPGTYFLQVSKPGYNATQTSINVQAGVDKPPIVKVLLVANPSARPFVQQHQFEGFLQCSASVTAPGVVGLSGNACSLLDVTGQPIDEPLIRYELERVPAWVQTEMVWESTQPAGGALELVHSWECDTNDGFYCDHAATGTSPLTVHSDATTIAEAGYGPGQPLIVRVFASELDESQGTAGATFDQRFTQYTNVFYGFEPIEGWSFIRDGSHPLPS